MRLEASALASGLARQRVEVARLAPAVASSPVVKSSGGLTVARSVSGGGRVGFMAPVEPRTSAADRVTELMPK